MGLSSPLWSLLRQNQIYTELIFLREGEELTVHIELSGFMKMLVFHSKGCLARSSKPLPHVFTGESLECPFLLSENEAESGT